MPGTALNPLCTSGSELYHGKEDEFLVSMIRGRLAQLEVPIF